jgi:two-component sensor histidine kinase
VAADDALARDLAALFMSLQTESEAAELPCSRMLRNVVADLAALFGSVAGDVILTTHIERVSLPAYKRRALVLAATELVINALLHAFRGRRQGRIEVSLTLLGPALAYLRVSDDGIGFSSKPSDYCGGIAARLADLLETDLVYYRTGIGTAALLVFPVIAQ